MARATTRPPAASPRRSRGVAPSRSSSTTSATSCTRPWLAPGIDRYCVAADEVGHDLVARGIPRERVVVTGVPVRTEFASAPDPREMRRALGLPAEVPVVLAMAGSWGSVGRLPDVARVL